MNFLDRFRLATVQVEVRHAVYATAYRLPRRRISSGPPVVLAAYSGVCCHCGGAYEKGNRIRALTEHHWSHAACAGAPASSTKGQGPRPMAGAWRGPPAIAGASAIPTITMRGSRDVARLREAEAYIARCLRGEATDSTPPRQIERDLRGYWIVKGLSVFDLTIRAALSEEGR